MSLQKFLFFDMKTQDGYRIEDENYMDPKKNRMMACKRMFNQEGDIFMLWGGEFNELSESEYQAKYDELHAN